MSSLAADGGGPAAPHPANLPANPPAPDLDPQSGNLLERAVFNHRLPLVIACVLITIGLGWLAATRLALNAGYEKMIPRGHPYIMNFLAHRAALSGLGNSVRVVVENPGGSIFEPGYLEALKQINDELFLTPGVDRAWMKSLWTPAVRWTEVTEEGFTGGPVMPDTYDGSPASTARLQQNIARSGVVGSLVANDFRSSMIFVPLLEKDPRTGLALDYREFSRVIEDKIRARYESLQPPGPAASGAADAQRVAQPVAPRVALQVTPVKVHVIGFAKVVGELMDGLLQMVAYFAVAAAIATGVIFLHTRCTRSTVLVVCCSIVAVVWQLGLVAWLGFELDPYSILVPFLVFAIGVSHGAQKMNGIMQDVGRGMHKLAAARQTFRRLFLAGLTALLADAVGFAVLMVIDIPVIQELALTASIGVAVLVFTNLLLLPVLLSYAGVSPVAAQRSLRAERSAADGAAAGGAWALLSRFTERRWAVVAIGVALLLAAGAFWVSLDLRIGDLDPGAPELRRDSRYNQDNAYITSHYALSSDQFAVIVATRDDGCMTYETLVEADRLALALQQVPGVQTTVALPDAVRRITAGSYEGNPKWLALSRNQEVLNYGVQQASVNNPDLFNTACSVLPVIAYLSDHKAETLERVAASAAQFAKQHNQADRQFLLAAGNAGIEAATNIVVREANRSMLLYVYAAVILLCFIVFRSWRAVVVAVVPLALTSILCEALMVALGMGVKVATLPVIALGVGIGVDYALYLLSVQLALQRQGLPLRQAYAQALQFTGKVVALVGITLAAGVVTWAWSPIKFQADMGILLTFMFVWNMVGALVLIPALSHVLLNPASATPTGVRPLTT